ncbi:MAG: hypothetical protein Kow0047_17450 [Anaerolineae bacterium]
MTPEEFPSIVVGYYESANDPPRFRATRCTAEVIAICEQLRIIADKLSIAPEARDIRDATHLCQLYYEDFIFRVYALFERGWDILEMLLDKPRGTLRKDKKAGLEQMRHLYPELYEAAMKLHGIVDLGVRMRNAATHETFLVLLLAFDSDYSDLYEIDSVFTWADPCSEKGMRIEEMVRKALRCFACWQRAQINEFILAAHAFASFCTVAVNSKRWDGG